MIKIKNLTLKDYFEFERRFGVSIFRIEDFLFDPEKVCDLRAEWIAYLTYLSWRKEKGNEGKSYDDFLKEIKDIGSLVDKFFELVPKKA